MSFLSLLLVACAFYFAHARPDSQTWDTALPGRNNTKESEQEPVAAEEQVEPIMDPSNYQHQLYGLMQDLSKAVDQHMTPLLTKLNEEEQEEFKAMCTGGFASYINYMLLLLQEKELDKKEDEAEYGNYSQPRHEMIIQYESPYAMDPNTPFMADTPYEDEDEE